MPALGASLSDIISQTAAGKGGGGEGPAQGFGEAGGAPSGSRPQQAGDQDAGETGDDELGPLDEQLAAGPDQLDPIGKFREQQLNLKTAASFSSNPRSANNMGPSTSEVLAMHGNKLRANAENWDRYLNTLRLTAELGRLGIGVPGARSGTEDAIKEELAKRAKGNPAVTPGGYNPASTPTAPANQPQNQPSAAPQGMDSARF